MRRFSNKWPKCCAVKNPAVTLIVSAGKIAQSSLYGVPQTGEGLDGLRYRAFYKKVSKSNTTVQRNSLPPISQPRLITALVCICKCSSG